MDPNAILLPMLVLVGLTFVPLGLIPWQRFRAVANKSIGPNDFKYGESVRVPGEVSIPNRNMMNLTEIPVLFYVVGFAAYLSGHVDMLAVTLAWIYVALRALHTGIHLTYNKVMHRLVPFALSNFVVMGMWLRLLLQL